MIIWITILFITTILCYLLFAPFYLEVDSNKNLYRIRFHHLASLAIDASDQKLLIKVMYWKKEIDLLHVSQTKDKTAPKKTIVKPKKQKQKFSWNQLKSVMMSFRINTCRITLDTGSVELNAWLYPIFYFIRIYSKKNITINFLNKNEVVLKIENNLARMAWAYLTPAINT